MHRQHDPTHSRAFSEDAGTRILTRVEVAGPHGAAAGGPSHDAESRRADRVRWPQPCPPAGTTRSASAPRIRSTSSAARPKEALLWLEDLVTIADLVRDTGDVAGVSRDPTDDFVLAAAIEGRANVIVTGDEDLLILEEHQGVAILTPRKFLDAIEG
jgi:PIN domain